MAEIVAKRFPVAEGVGGHLYLEFKNDNGDVMGQVHGLATGLDGTIQAVGSSVDGDLLSSMRKFLKNVLFLFSVLTLTACFEKLDSDGDGFVSAEIGCEQYNFPLEYIQKKWKSADGQNGIKMFLRLPELQPMATWIDGYKKARNSNNILEIVLRSSQGCKKRTTNQTTSEYIQNRIDTDKWIKKEPKEISLELFEYYNSFGSFNKIIVPRIQPKNELKQFFVLCVDHIDTQYRNCVAQKLIHGTVELDYKYEYKHIKNADSIHNFIINFLETTRIQENAYD